MCTVLLPPGDNPIAVNKYINIKINIIGNEKKLIESKRIILNIRQGVKFFIYDLEISKKKPCCLKGKKILKVCTSY